MVKYDAYFDVKIYICKNYYAEIVHNSKKIPIFALQNVLICLSDLSVIVQKVESYVITFF